MKRFLGILSQQPVKYSQHSEALPQKQDAAQARIQELEEQLEIARAGHVHQQALASHLENKVVGLEAKYRALLIERDFWVEQGRNLQNQLSSFQRMYAGMFDQLGKGVVTEESIAENLALASEQLRAPLTTVEATRALIAMQDPLTQGAYTSAHGSNRTQRLEQ